MGFFKSLFSSPQISEEQQQEQVSVEKKRIAFETLRDGGVRAITLKEYKLAEDYFVKAIELNSDDEEIEQFSDEEIKAVEEVADLMEDPFHHWYNKRTFEDKEKEEADTIL